ncbi:MAG: LamG domain-containing protein [Spirochaetales bacterium]|nr:LamG domain-containing protein [Spirochaetales bacterium]
MKHTIIKSVCIAAVSFSILILASCDDDFWTLSPTLDNPWDPDNPNYSIPEVPTDGLLAEYLFTGNINDSSGNGNNLTGTVGTYVDDRLGNADSALGFDGTDDYLVFPSSDTGKFVPNGNMTISFWFKSAVNNGTIFGHSSFYDAYGWKLCTALNTSDLEFSSDRLSDEVSVGESAVNGYWHHVLLMNDGSFIRFYLDGESQYLKFGTAEIEYSTTQDELYFFIGARYTNWVGETATLGRFFTGVLDDIRIYDRNLTEDEIKALTIEGLID